MAHPVFPLNCLTAALIALSMTMSSASAQWPQPSPPQVLDASLSPECSVPASLLHTLAPLDSVRRALAAKRPFRVLALGSSGEAGGGAARYEVRLKDELERVLGADVEAEVEQRSLPGEITAEAVERITRLVAETEPDLVVWKVGTNDALARADVGEFAQALDDVLAWLSEHDVGVVLVEPPYSPFLAEDEYYRELIAAIHASAAERQVPLVLRFETLRFLGQQVRGGKAPLTSFELSHLGGRCIAEHVTRTVGLSLLLKPSAAQGRSGALPTRP